MDDVATHLGISKKTLYQYVESKDELVVNILDQCFTRRKNLAEVLSARAANAIEEFLQVLVNNLREIERMSANLVHDLQKYHPPAWERLQQYQHDFLVGWTTANLRRGQTEGMYRDDFDLQIVARLHVGSALLVFDPAWFPDTGFPRGTVLHTFMTQFLYSVATPKGLAYIQKNINHHG